MTIFQNISLPDLIRYVVTGIVAIAVFALLPALAERPERAEKVFTAGGVTSIAMFALVIGFLLDALKTYQLFPEYQEFRNAYLEELSKALGVSRSDALSCLSKAVQLERTKGGATIFFLYSRWVMINIMSTLFWTAGLLWGFVGLWKTLFHPRTTETGFLVSSLVLLIFGLRLINTSNQEQARVNHAYIRFSEENRELIMAPIVSFHVELNEAAAKDEQSNDEGAQCVREKVASGASSALRPSRLGIADHE